MGGMQRLDLTLPSAAENLALDEALLLEAESRRGGEILRLWEWPQPAVVLGSGGVLHEDVNEGACAADGVPILRRSSGGGTVLLGSGCLCYSLVLSMQGAPELSAIRPSYTVILSRIAEAILPAATIAGISDLAAEGRKFSGSAQQRKRSFLLHHGTLLHAFDLSLAGRYLREPVRQPEYRAGREHCDFMRNLPVSAKVLRARICAVWQANEEASDWPREEVQRLLEEKYCRDEWTRRR